MTTSRGSTTSSRSTPSIGSSRVLPRRPSASRDAVGAALSAAGFAQFDFRQAILYGVPSSDLTSSPSHITIERVTPDNLEDYLTHDGRRVRDAAGVARCGDGRGATTVRRRQQRFLARIGGEPAAVATLRVRDGVASLGGGATVPRHRNKGCHSALVRHRLDVAYLLGCTLVMGGANYGSGSFRNQLRHGLRLAYVESGWRRTSVQ